jgi:glutamate-1-semialdehyde 2,1-aminomutase
VDGNEYVDFHNGFGVMCVGHANPVIAAAVKRRVERGTHFAAPTEGSIVVAEELARRFGLPQWRFTNSGTESTMDAVHVARGATGRDLILKIEGSYHGHHDAVMVSVYPPLEALGERDDPRSVPYGEGYPTAITELTHSVPFNDADALATVLEKLEDQVAALIMEPAMMNINIIPPVEGYLEEVRRLTAAHGVVLVFDEVKTGATISPGGATQRFGVTPDVITLAKATCGGLPGGAIGMTDALAAMVADGRVHQYGIIERYRLPCYTQGLGAKGCVVFSAEPLREYRDYLTKVDDDLSTLAWLQHMNHGIFMTPGVEEEWTLSIAHTDEHLQRYLDAFETFAQSLNG